MINDKCPVCGKNEFQDTRFSGKGEFKVVACDNCQTCFTLIERDIDTESLYKEGVYEVIDNRGSIFDKLINRESRAVLGSVDSISQPASVLDFGCGKGQFLNMAQTSGLQAFGVETSKPRARFAREKYGLEIQDSFYTEGALANTPFDLITLFHVLEHLQDPYLVERLCKDNLDEGGLLVVEVPNLASWQAKLAKDNWMHLDLPKHVLHFTPATLDGFLKKIGFRIIKKEHYSFHLGVLGMLRAMLGRLGYKGNIIYDLKNRVLGYWTFLLLLVLPVAFLTEVLASKLGRGGIIRVYVRR